MRLRVRTGVLAGALVVLPALVLPTPPAHAAATGPPTGTGGPMTLTQKLDDFYVSGKPGTTASVTVSQTDDLTRQRVSVSWTGLRPSAGADYPVVIMQCWGAPSAVRPQHCWTGSRRMDRATLFDDKDFRKVSDTDPYNTAYYDPADLWGNRTPASQFAVNTGYLPFVSRAGTWYGWGATTDVSGQWPGRAIVSKPPPDQSEDTGNFAVNPALTKPDGKADYPFEVLTNFELPSLGCTDADACSLVVIPVGDPHCRPRDRYMAPLSRPTDANGTTVERQCAGTGVGMRDETAWKSPTNWERRFVFPLSFRKPQQVCDLDNRAETTLVGSQLARAAMASWRPRFCTDRALFKLGYTALGDGDARRQFVDNGPGRSADGVNGMLTSRAVDGPAGRPVAYGPVAVTAFTVAYVLDDMDRNEVTRLRFTPRLLAKLITQSYPGTYGRQQAAPTATNPVWWGADKDFLAENPGIPLRAVPEDANFTPLLVQGDLDLVHALTGYIASDPAAVAWLSGRPDPWGMIVNPQFRDYRLPADQFELRDGWRTPKADQAHTPFADVEWHSLAANQAANLLDMAVATMQARPTATLQFERSEDPAPSVPPKPPLPDTYKRLPRQEIGKRALLSIIGLADARQFQVRTAALRTAGGGYVEPTATGMQYALNAAVTDDKTGILMLDHAKMDSRGYPGTMAVYAGLPTAGLAKEAGEHYATFLDYAAGAGQEVGVSIGQLPSGYLPLTQPLRDYAAKVARAVREQKGEVPTPPDDLTGRPDADAATGVREPGGPTQPGQVPAGGSAPSAAPAANAGKAPVLTAGRTRTQTSNLARWILPVLLGIGLVAGLLAPITAVAVRPGHPARRFTGRAFRWVVNGRFE